MKVTDVKTAQLLCDYKVTHHLAPFLATECTAAEAAVSLRVSKQRMIYWINKLLKHGFLKFVRYDINEGHRAAVYRSVEDEYIVPFSLLGHDVVLDHIRSSHAIRFEQLDRSIARNLSRRASTVQLRVWRDAQGPFTALENPNNTEDYLGIVDETYPLWIDENDLSELHKDIRALLAKYYARSDRKKSKTALLYVGMAENPIWSTEL
jgi:hypothetical protein